MADSYNTQAQKQPPRPGPGHEISGVVVGKWIDQDHTVDSLIVPLAAARGV